MAYAWSDIQHHKGVVKRGEKVTKDDIGTTDEHWQELLDSGIVRDQKFPDFVRNGETPKRAILRKAREAMEQAEQGVWEEHHGVLSSEHNGDPVVQGEAAKSESKGK